MLDDETPISADTVDLDSELDSDIEQAIADLVQAADTLRYREEQLRADLDRIRARRVRLDKAVSALTAPAPDRSVTERKTVKRKHTQRDTNFAVTHAAPNYPSVSESKQARVLEILTKIGRPAKPTEINGHPDFDMSRSTTQNALAHLRARGLVRWAGSSGNSGHLYAPFDNGGPEDDTEPEDAA
jgi:hypothetical protein